jgi:hypothetical protein
MSWKPIGVPVRVPYVKRTMYCIRSLLTPLRACRDRLKTR